MILYVLMSACDFKEVDVAAVFILFTMYIFMQYGVHKVMRPVNVQQDYHLVT